MFHPQSASAVPGCAALAIFFLSLALLLSRFEVVCKSVPNPQHPNHLPLRLFTHISPISPPSPDCALSKSSSCLSPSSLGCSSSHHSSPVSSTLQASHRAHHLSPIPSSRKIPTTFHRYTTTTNPPYLPSRPMVTAPITILLYNQSSALNFNHFQHLLATPNFLLLTKTFSELGLPAIGSYTPVTAKSVRHNSAVSMQLTHNDNDRKQVTTTFFANKHGATFSCRAASGLACYVSKSSPVFHLNLLFLQCCCC